MAKKTILIGVIYTVAIYFIAWLICSGSYNKKMNVIKDRYEERIAIVRDSVNYTKDKFESLTIYSDSLEILIELLPDSSSFREMESMIDSLTNHLKRKEQDRLSLVKRINDLSRIGSRRDESDIKKIIKEYLDSISQIEKYKKDGKPFHIHIHNYESREFESQFDFSKR